MAESKKINLLVPVNLLEEIDEMAQKLGVTRTAYIVMSMSQKIQAEKSMQVVPQLNELINQLSQMGVYKDGLPIGADVEAVDIDEDFIQTKMKELQ